MVRRLLTQVRPGGAVAVASPRNTEEERTRQVEYYRKTTGAEDEITRPRCYPRAVRYLLTLKVRLALSALRFERPGGRLLAVCCGSGMDAEWLARRGFKVVGVDFSREAVLRAKERARRYGVHYDLVVGDAEHLPFRDGAFDVTFVHDGLHHLSDAYRGVREMVRVATRAVAIAEPANGVLTRLAVRLGLAGRYEEAGNYVFRLSERRLAQVFSQAGARGWAFRRDFIYYQPWTFKFYKICDRDPMFLLFKLCFYLCNLTVGRWGNSLKAVAWKA